MEINKIELLAHISKSLNIQISDLKLEIDSILREMGEETKSSAGDKFETSREMMNQERGRLEDRLHHLNENVRLMETLNSQKKSEVIGLGSLVITDFNCFLFGIALGKYNFKEQEVFLLSLNSPIGKVFVGKKQGDKIEFSNKIYSIKEIH